jgi:hypothetical protein
VFLSFYKKIEKLEKNISSNINSAAMNSPKTLSENRICYLQLGLFHLKMGKGGRNFANFRDPPIQKNGIFETPLYNKMAFLRPPIQNKMPTAYKST